MLGLERVEKVWWKDGGRRRRERREWEHVVENLNNEFERIGQIVTGMVTHL